MTRRRTLVAAALAAAAALVGVSLASASGFPLVGLPVSSAVLTHPCPGTATAEPALSQGGGIYRGVALTLPAGCADRYVQLTMIRPGTDRAGDGTTDANGELTIDFGWRATYDEDDDNTFIATVAGWALDIDWWVDPSPYIWCTVVGNPAAQCTATVTLFHGTKPGGGEFDYYDVLVTTSSTTYVEWEVGFNLAHQFYGTVPETLGNSTLDGFWDGSTNWSGDDADVERVSQCSEYPGLLSVRGESHGTANNYEDVQNNRARSFSLVLDYQQGTYDDLVPATCSP